MLKVNKKINLSQLDNELNSMGLICSYDENNEITEIGLAENNPATEAELQGAIDAHIAKPIPERTIEDKLASVGLTIDDLKVIRLALHNLEGLC